MSGEIVTLKNSRLRVEIVAPMTACMAEYGPRFDTTGAAVDITFEGENVCAREGLIDEFNIQPPFAPPGYEEASPGESFVKIGVGELIRTNEHPYSFSHPYAIRRLAPVAVARSSSGVTLSQKLCVDAEWGYDYRKTYRVLPDAATLVVDYALSNTGQCPIVAEHYNHNWFNFGGTPIDEAYGLTAEFAIDDTRPLWLAPNRLGLSPATCLATPCYFPSSVASDAFDHAMRLNHAGRRRTIVVSGDSDVARFALYADATAFCPEVFSLLQVSPGETATWSRRYDFFCGDDDSELP